MFLSYLYQPSFVKFLLIQLQGGDFIFFCLKLILQLNSTSYRLPKENRLWLKEKGFFI